MSLLFFVIDFQCNSRSVFANLHKTTITKTFPNCELRIGVQIDIYLFIYLSVLVILFRKNKKNDPKRITTI